jgi:hypothetical protein
MIARVLIYSSIAILLAGCSLPPPDDVVRACLDELANNNYTKMLAYTGPDICFAYSNNLWLSRVHQVNVKDQDVIVEPFELLSSTTAIVRTHITFHQKRTKETYPLHLRLDMTLRDKWYIDDIWYLDENGAAYKNAIQNIPSSPFMF